MNILIGSTSLNSHFPNFLTSILAEKLTSIKNSYYLRHLTRKDVKSWNVLFQIHNEKLRYRQEDDEDIIP